MTTERITLGSYRIPRDGTDDDRDDIEYTVESPITVNQSGVVAFKLTVNWPNNLDNVRVTIITPSSATPSNPSISPQQSGQAIDEQSDRAVFTHDAASTGNTISYKLDITPSTSGAAGVTFILEADEFVGPLSRSEEVMFEN